MLNNIIPKVSFTPILLEKSVFLTICLELNEI